MSRCDIRENERHNRQSLSVFSRRKRPKGREKDTRRRERLRTRLRFSSDFASPPKSFSPIDEIRKHAKERKKERTMRYILLSFFRAVLLRRRLYIVLMNYVCVVSASVSLGQFYRYLVRIHHGTLLDAENDLRSNSISTTTKKKVKRNERRALKESKRST